jgi:hypothetical protein
MHSDAGSHHPPALCALKQRTFLVPRHNLVNCHTERTPWRAKTQVAIWRDLALSGKLRHLRLRLVRPRRRIARRILSF